MRRYFLHFLLVFSFLIAPSVSAQFKDYSFKIGIQGSYLLPGNEYTEENHNTSLLFRPHIGFQLSQALDLGIGLGYGWMQGEDYTNNKYETSFIPLDIRLVLSPFNSDAVNPYLYIGGGVSYWSLDDPPATPTVPIVDDNGIAGLVEGGLGIEIALSNSIVLDFTAGFNSFLTDDTNGEATKLQDKFLHEYDRYINLGLGLTFVMESCSTDEDGDGINKCDEDKLGTDPENPDTDNDGLTDGEEVNIYKTNPLNPDTDGDGLKDGEEVKTYKTDPLNPDTDGDGLLDGEEVNRYKTDPLNPDTDGDGLNDGAEVHTYKTDPLNPDTDGDGLNDGDEVNKYKTDPLNPDTDGDGLNDGDEVNKYKTDPKDVDTDDGSIGDGVEVKRGTDPLDPFDDVPKIEEGIPLEILFELGKAKIRDQYQDKLEQALKYLNSHPDVSYEIHGHASTDGSTEFNQKLSEARAKAVVDWLVERNVAASRLTSMGHGETQPVMVNGVEDRVASRRVITIISK